MSTTNWLTRLRAMPATARWLVMSGGLLAIVAIAAIAMRVVRDGTAESSREDETTARQGAMAGMEGMDMSADGAVRLTAEQMRTFGITLGTVEQRTLEADVRTVGVVSFDETRVAQVTPRFSGYIEELYVEYLGQRVQRGQRLAAIYSPELVAAQEELLLARRLDGTVGESAVPGVPAGAADLLGAARRRMQLWDISDAQIDEILRSGRVQRALTLYSPVSGVVTEKNVVQGQAIQAGQMLFTISDLSEVWIEAELRERELASVRTGTAADIEVAAYPDRSFAGRVEFIDPTLDSRARTAKARVAVRNGRALLKPGMFATVRLETPTRTALTAPTSAIIRTGERTVVFVDFGNGRLTPQEIDIGRVAGEVTEVLAGLEPGQRVVTSAQFLLDSESNLAEVMKAMMGQMGTADMADMDMDVMPGMR
jgi:multidrug efflux pump subunit AcrA (membrane-fusion protein)